MDAALSSERAPDTPDIQEPTEEAPVLSLVIPEPIVVITENPPPSSPSASAEAETPLQESEPMQEVPALEYVRAPAESRVETPLPALPTDKGDKAIKRTVVVLGLCFLAILAFVFVGRDNKPPVGWGPKPAPSGSAEIWYKPPPAKIAGPSTTASTRKKPSTRASQKVMKDASGIGLSGVTPENLDPTNMVLPLITEDDKWILPVDARPSLNQLRQAREVLLSGSWPQDETATRGVSLLALRKFDSKFFLDNRETLLALPTPELRNQLISSLEFKAHSRLAKALKASNPDREKDAL